MASTTSALRVLAVGPLLALGVAGAMSACGGTSVKHVDGDAGTGNGASGGAHNGGTGGTGIGGTGIPVSGSGGTGGGVQSPLCETVGDYAGTDYVYWNVPPDTPCGGGATEWCFFLGDPKLGTCMDAGAPKWAPPADAAPGAAPAPSDPEAPVGTYCPNVRYLCSTMVGCCEDVATLIAGPRPKFDASGATQCCYLAMSGLRER
jgi:hypothetical protein